MKTLTLRPLAVAATFALLAVVDTAAAQTNPATATPQEPIAQGPAAQEPISQGPAAQEPISQAPAAQEPAAQAPAAQAPAAQAPAARQERARAQRVRRDLISREEIAASGATNLYEVVQRLRPGWLRPGGASNIRGGGTGVVVYQNSTPLGGPDALRQLTPGYATGLRFLEGTEASNTLPGLGSRRVAGAIVVMLPGS